MDTTESRHFAARLADLLKHERHAMVEFLVALAEFDRRRAWITLGYANLFDFLHRDLGLSKGTAFYRKTAAELLQSYPEMVEPLRDGRLCVTALHALSKAITPDNRAAVLPRFFHLSKQEARAVSAEIAPPPVVAQREVVTVVRPPPAAALPLVTAPSSQQVDGLTGTLSQNSQPVGSSGFEPGPMPAAPRRLEVEPLTKDERRIHITVSPQFLEKLDAARLALSHSLPGASAEDVLSCGLDLLLERDAKRKGLVARPRPAPANSEAEPGAVHIPAAVRRDVWRRDKGCCQWPIAGGGVCGSKLRLELDHINLRCRGAKPIASELRILCSVHNKLAARLALGDRVMDRYTRHPRQREQLSLAAVPEAGNEDKALHD
jgi:hypothetical protein